MQSIFTTNIDDLIYKIYHNSEYLYLNDTFVYGVSDKKKESVDYYPLHGCVKHPGSDYTFTVAEISSIFSTHPTFWQILIKSIKDTPTLFWGYSLDEPGPLEALSTAGAFDTNTPYNWILLRNPNMEEIDYFQALGLSVIKGDTETLLDFFGKISANQRCTPITIQDTPSLFPHEALPSLASVVARPIENFYRGSPPSWYDIYYSKIPKTSNFVHAHDVILSGKDVYLIGLPLSGKTTLLMQLAAAGWNVHHVLLCNSITADHARQIIKKLSRETAIIFIDNLQDSVSALRVFSDAKNVQIVAAENTYSFDSVSHLTPKRANHKINVTGLTNQDLQKIYDALPLQIRKQEMIIPHVDTANDPFMFEHLRANIKGSDLLGRLRTTISQLWQTDKAASEFLTLSCFVHSCRTPLSYDLAYLTLSHHLKDYFDLYEISTRLRELVDEVEPPEFDDTQDYFMPRSVGFSDIVIHNTPVECFRRIFERIHYDVSPFVIPRYDIFRRNAFHHDYVKLAYPNVSDGVKFYEDAYRKEGTPYIKQHAALYLADKKRFKQAFAYIDEAVNLSGGRIFTIKNSHAYILFSANENTADPDDPEVYASLQRSMSILEECYRHDKRKVYHSLRYADQAMKFWNLYGNKQAESYLEQARQWLEEQKKEASHNHAVHRLLGLVRKRLNR